MMSRGASPRSRCYTGHRTPWYKLLATGPALLPAKRKGTPSPVRTGPPKHRRPAASGQSFVDLSCKLGERLARLALGDRPSLTFEHSEPLSSPGGQARRKANNFFLQGSRSGLGLHGLRFYQGRSLGTLLQQAVVTGLQTDFPATVFCSNFGVRNVA